MSHDPPTLTQQLAELIQQQERIADATERIADALERRTVPAADNGLCGVILGTGPLGPLLCIKQRKHTGICSAILADLGKST